LTFDAEDRLTAYAGELTAGYTGDGFRGWKETTAGRTYFLYDGPVPIVELSSAGTVTATNTIGANGLVSRRMGSASTFYTFDPQGSVTQRLDGSQSVLTSHLYDAHGAALGSAISDPFGFGGQWGYYTDHETGLQLLTHRYYDPGAGRFITRDPSGYSGGINLYAYVENNPTGFIDPDGLDKFKLPKRPGPNGRNLPPGWKPRPEHTGSERWVSPDGKEGLDFDEGRPGAEGFGVEDGWHKLKPKRGRKDRWVKIKSGGRKGGHYLPGDEVDLDSYKKLCPKNPYPPGPTM